MSEDWLSTAFDGFERDRRRADRQARAAVLQAQVRATEARDAELSRRTRLPVETIRTNRAEIEAELRARESGDLFDLSTPRTKRWLTDERNAASAARDMRTVQQLGAWVGPVSAFETPEFLRSPALANLGVYARDPREPRRMPTPEESAALRRIHQESLAEEFAKAQQEAQRLRPAPTLSSLWTGTAIDTVQGVRQSWIGTKLFLADAFGVREQGPIFQEILREYEASQLKALQFRPQLDDSPVGNAVYGGVTSLLQTVPALVAGAFTGGTSAVLTLFGWQSGTSAYGRYRQRGATANEALLGGTLEGGIEVATELAPTRFLLGNFGRKGAAGFITGFLGREMLTEQIATLGQDAVDTAIANPTATWDQYWADRPMAAFNTAVSSLIASTAIGGTSAIVRQFKGVTRDLDDVTAAYAGLSFLDQMVAMAGETSMAKEDPQGLREFIAAQTEGTAVDRVYVPGEAVRSLFQSEGMDYRSDPFWGEYADQIEEAAAINGDVVIPIADAVVEFTAGGRWDTLRDSVRLSPGGMSMAEARSITESYQEMMTERGEELRAQVEAMAEQIAPVRRVYDAVLSQSRQAGMSLNAAQAYADLFAERYAARAETMGTDAWSLFQQSVGGIVGEAPLAVRRYEAADQFDRLVGVMRRGRAAPTERARRGPSLLEWIAARGGIEDRGGDIAHMGGESWHREAPFRRKLIRPHEEGQGVFFGSPATRRANSPESLFEAAISSGFFNDLIVQREEAQTYDEALNIGVFMDAIRSELAGSPVYSTDPGEAGSETDAEVRAAAEDLRAFLENRGVDADTASVEEIREAVRKEEGDFHRQLEQRVFHGSRSRFSAFDSALLGPVAGNFGWGHYFASREEIAEEYRGPDGAVYTVDIPEDGEFMQWESPLSEQPERVREALASLPVPEGPFRVERDGAGGWNVRSVIDGGWMYAEGRAGLTEEEAADASADFTRGWERTHDGGFSGRDVYRWLAGVTGSERGASLLLRDVGIAGNRYRDAEGSDSFNYVVFDDRVISMADDGTVSFYQSQPEHPLFYSGLQRALDANRTAKASAEQWLATLRNTPGVKAEEMEWSGLVEFLEEQPGPISRTDIQVFLNQGGIRVDEVLLGEPNPRAVAQLAETLLDQEASRLAAEELAQYYEPWGAGDNVATVVEVADEESGEVVAWEFDGVEYSSEDEAAGAREDAVTRAEMGAERERLAQIYDDVRSKLDEREFTRMAEEQLGVSPQFGQWTSTGQATESYRELLITLPLGKGRNPTRAPDTHWLEPGVVAHVRFQAKRDRQGRPVLFVEEVQSDWHQKGRDHGYEKVATEEEVAAAKVKWDEAKMDHLAAQQAIIAYARELRAYSHPEISVLEQTAAADRALKRLADSLDNLEPNDVFARQIADQHVPGEVVARINELRATEAATSLRLNEAIQEYRRVSLPKGVPDAPFKTTWPALVMKRVIRWAADNGYSSVAWTTGEQQADRYNISFVTGQITARREGSGYSLDFEKAGVAQRIENAGYGEWDSDEDTIFLNEGQMREVFGESLAQQIVDRAPASGENVTLGDSDLKVGGEGMRAFYDRNLVNITNDLIKKYGAKVRPMAVLDEERIGSIRVQLAMRRQPRPVLEVEREYEAAVERLDTLDREEADPEDIREARSEVSRLLEEIADASVLRDFSVQQWGFEVTDKMREAAQSGFSLFQGGDNRPRGRIDFDRDNRAVIRLFEGRDLSTLLHEAGHLWLEELKADAQRPDAPQQVKDDWRTVRAWFRANGHRVKRDGTVPTDAHELWARGFERFAMEGKAPSSALARAFDSFRSWLLRIYKVVANLDAPLTDEVRAVMGRMLATQDAIDQVAAEAESALLFKSAAEAGMTDAEFGAYREAAQGTRSEAFDALLYRTMEAIRRERTAVWKRERATVRAEVEEAVRKRPEFRALDMLRGRGGERVQLSRQAIVETYGSDMLAMLPRGVPPTIVETGGVHPQALAELAGFQTADEMINLLAGIETRQRELRAAGDRRSVAQEEIDQLTDQAMRERHGDVLSDGSIEEEALAAIHNDRRAEVIASEVRALARRSSRPGDQVPTPWRLAREWASRLVREGTVAEQASASALARHRRNEAKAARAAEAAMLAGNVDEAYRQKQSQMFHHALFRAAKEAKDQTDAIVKRLGKFAKARSLPSMDPEYLDRIHELLEAYDFKRRTQREQAERKSFMEWAAQREEAGEEVFIPPRLADIGTTNFSALQVQDLVGLDDAVASLAHLGRRKRKLLAAREEADLEDLVAEALAAGNNLPPRKSSAERNEPNDWRRKLRGFDALTVKMEFLADQLDDNNPNGAFNRVLIRGATDAANKKEELVDRVLRPLADLYNSMPKDQQRRLGQKVTVPELVTRDAETGEEVPTVFSRSDILAIALNTGNESNLSKLLRGESLGLSADNAWTIDKVQAVLDREMNEADWQFVSAVWRQVDSLWPDIVRAEREITGLKPEKVQPRMVQTRFGTIEGGYYPVVFDPTRSVMAQANYEDDAAKLLGQMGRAVSTPKGHTITRTEAAAPLLLDLEGVLFNHVSRVTTRIAYGRFVRDVLKFTSHPKIRDLVNRKLGPEYQRQFKEWLKRQVNDAVMDTEQLAALAYWLRKFRINTTMVGLGFRFTTMAAQTAGLSNSASEIGAEWLAKGMAEAAANMGEARNFVFARSPEMAGRAQSFDRDIRTFFKDMSVDRGSLVRNVEAKFDPIRGAAFWGIGNVQLYVVDMATWLGGYRKALDEGMTEDEAAAYGDKVVRRSQGSGRPKDLSAIQDASEGYRVLTLFYSWFNVLYNKQRDTLHAAKRGDYRRAAANVVWVMMVGPIMAAFLTGDWPVEEEEEGWAEWALRKMFFGLWLGIPGVRDVVGGVEREVSGRQSFPTTAPFFRAFEELKRPVRDAVDVASGDAPSDRWLQNAITAPGYFVGLPTGQAGATAQYLLDVSQGDQEPEGVGDVIAGIAKGPREEQE